MLDQADRGIFECGRLVIAPGPGKIQIGFDGVLHVLGLKQAIAEIKFTILMSVAA